MSETLFRFLLSDLEKVRLVCQNERCGAVVEISFDRLAAQFNEKCPGCERQFFGAFTHDQNPLRRLAEAIKDIRKHPKDVQIEFAIPVRQ